MSELVIEVPTDKKSMAELRDALDAAIQKQFPGGMMKSHWVDEVLELSGPGAKGSVVLEDGQLVGRAELSPPASLMKPMIQQKVTAALQDAVGDG